MNQLNKQLSNLWGFMTEEKLWIGLGKGLFEIIMIAIISLIVVRIGKRITERVFSSEKRGRLRISERREKTLKKLIQNMLAYVIYFIAFMMIIETMGLPIASLLAGAGVAGLAIGFGAQNLVRDIISGFFIIFEDQFSIGDYIITSDVEGEVEEIGIRTTKIQSWTGEQNVIPNGNITQVTNYSIHNCWAIVDINIPYESDINLAEKIIEDVIAKLPAKYEEIVSQPTLVGVQSLELSHVVIRVMAETLPVYHWAGARVIRKEVKERLFNEGIDIPSPRLVMYSRNEQPTALEMTEK